MPDGLYTWYVIKTRPRNEKKVAAVFEKLGWVHQLPLYKVLRQWKDRKKWVEFPLFPSYIFLYIDPVCKNKVYEVSGVLGFLKIGNEVATVQQTEIERIDRICRSGLSVEVSYELLVRGDEVNIIDGPLKGLSGIVLKTVNGTKVHIAIEAIACTLSVDIDKSFLKKSKRK